MSPTAIDPPSIPIKHKHSTSHPLDSISAAEIVQAADIVRAKHPANTDLHFKAVTLEEPPKALLVPYLQAEHDGKELPHIDRKVFVLFYLRNTDKLFEAIVNMTRGGVESILQMGANQHAQVDASEIIEIEQLILENEEVQAAIAELQLPQGTAVVCDPWIYGSDGVDDDRRMFQTFLYMRDPTNPEDKNGNHYAFPLPISPVLDSVTKKIIRIDGLPTGADATVKKWGPLQYPAGSEYTPEYQKLRTDLKPLHIIQPDGASFTVTASGPAETGHVIKWQKWSMRHGFNQREGMVLYDIHYDDRSIFHRVSLSDMNIPYADPRSPFHRKSAFDLGDTGAGIMANNLQLGCDCLGSIHYLSAVISDSEGQPLPLDNVVCIHEQDAGIGWKHTNFRTNVPTVTRSRELVIQSIITVANYEYILAFIFNEAGEMSYEVRATGIVSTQPIDADTSVPWGTVVHPGVLASHHQHIFSLRIDPAIDGIGAGNTLVASEIFPLEPGTALNPHGTGYTLHEHAIPHSTGLDLNTATNLTYKVTNPSSLNPVNGEAVGYKILPPDFQKIVAHHSSFHHARAEFADHNIYLVRHVDGELYAGGKYTNQSRGHPIQTSTSNNNNNNNTNSTSGVRTSSLRASPTLNTDIVLFVQFGLQHVVRVEDWPVMPCESIRVRCVPCNFFTRNPAMDVAPSEKGERGGSVLLNGSGNGCESESGCGGNGNGNGNGVSAATLHHQPALEGRIVGVSGDSDSNGHDHEYDHTNGTIAIHPPQPPRQE